MDETLEPRLQGWIAEHGAATGAELRHALGAGVFTLWRTATLSPDLVVRRVGRRYVRLDRKVRGYARLSPSIAREFLTYTVVGRADDPASVEARVATLAEHIATVSDVKRFLARRIASDLTGPFAARYGADTFCVVIAGDVAYDMAHDVGRPERSTGIMVQGSDLDLVILIDDDAPDALATGLDDAIYARKYQYLRNRAFREELDYVVKRVATLRQQASFVTFEQMVACKVFAECQYLIGSQRLFQLGKDILTERGVMIRLNELEASAIVDRVDQESYLAAARTTTLTGDDLLLFHAAEESEEFE